MTMLPFFTVLLLFSTLLETDSSTPSVKHGPSSASLLKGGFVATLVHKSSANSPFKRMYTPAGQNDGFRSVVDSEYTMKVTVGGQVMYLTPDTGSDITWVQCKTCKECRDQKGPLYDPTKSTMAKTTYSCGTMACNMIPEENRVCSADRACTYAIEYGDRSLSSGPVMSDTFGFQGNDTNGSRVDVSFRDVVFGCATIDNDTTGDTHSGILGLMNSTGTLIRQLDLPKFSYCMGSLESADAGDGTIRFGDEAMLAGTYITPILPNPHRGWYFLNMTSIFVGNVELEVYEHLRMMGGDDKKEPESGLIIDSGTTYTKLYNPAFKKLLKALQENTNGSVQLESWDFCIPQDTSRAPPSISFQFTNFRYDISLNNSWKMVDNEHACLAMRGSNKTISILGYYNLKGVNIGYDLANSLLYLNPTNDCVDP